MHRRCVCSSDNGSAVSSDESITVPITPGNNLLHDVGRRTDDLVDSALVSTIGLSGHHCSVDSEFIGVSTLAGVPIEVVRGALTAAGAANHKQAGADYSKEVTITAIEHSIFDGCSVVSRQCSTEGCNGDTTCLVGPGLLSDQAGNIAVSSSNLEAAFSR